MKIFLKIFDSNKGEPQKFEFNGMYALEIMINKLLLIYYGGKISSKVEDLLRERRKTVDELNDEDKKILKEE